MRKTFLRKQHWEMNRNQLEKKFREGNMSMEEGEGQKRWCVSATNVSRGLAPRSAGHRGEEQGQLIRGPWLWTSLVTQSCEKSREDLSQKRDVTGFAL